MVDELPPRGFALVDVGYSMIEADMVPRHLELAMLDTKLVSHVSDYLNDLILQANLAF